MSFNFIQTVVNNGTGNVLTCSFNAGAGHLIVVCAASGGTASGTPSAVIQDQSSNVYGQGPNSFAGADSLFWYGVVGYMLAAPGGATTVMATFSGISDSGDFGTVTIMEFSYNGTAFFDNDANSIETSNTATPITTPSLQPTNNGSLICANYITTFGSPTGALNPWTDAIGNGLGENIAFALNVSNAAPIASNFGDSANPDIYGNILACFYTVPTAFPIPIIAAVTVIG